MRLNITIIVIGHITKDGQIAGPKILEHMVDAVLHFEGDKNIKSVSVQSPGQLSWMAKT